jgi:hypothetical protein
MPVMNLSSSSSSKVPFPLTSMSWCSWIGSKGRK